MTTDANRTEVPADLVMTGCTALLQDDDSTGPDAGIRFAEDMTIVVTDGAIRDVLTGATSVPPARETIDARGQLAMPGLVNCHTHSPMVLFRGAAEDVPVADWFNQWIWPMEVNLTPDDVELGARLAAAEMIRAGVTCFADHYFAMDRVAAVVEETGLRANLGWTYFSSEGESGRERSLEFALGWRGRAGGRITTSLAPHGAYTVSEPDLRRTATMAAEHDLPVHIHASENRDQTLVSRAKLGVTPIEVLRRNGILDQRTLIAHGVGIVPEDVPTLAAARDHVGVATAPKGYLKSMYDTTPIRLLWACGVPVGLATDGAASNNTLDVWESMLFTALLQKTAERDSLWLTARQALDCATRQSAAASASPARWAGSPRAIAPTWSWSTSAGRTRSRCTTWPRRWSTARAPPTSPRPSSTAESSCGTVNCSPWTSTTSCDGSARAWPP